MNIGVVVCRILNIFSCSGGGQAAVYAGVVGLRLLVALVGSMFMVDVIVTVHLENSEIFQISDTVLQNQIDVRCFANHRHGFANPKS